MKPRHLLWVLLAALVLVAMNGGFSVPVWTRHGGGGIRPHTANETHVIMPTCPSDVSLIEFGTFCKDPMTSKIMHRGTLEAIP